jgi:hypothetical protein
MVKKVICTQPGWRAVGCGLLLLICPLVMLQAAEQTGMTDAKLRALWPLWRGKRTTEQVVARYGDLAEGRLKPHFDKAGLTYPPERIALVVLKEEKQMELWVWHKDGWRHVHDYPIQGASGHAGPKLRQGDRQVPEGMYRVLYLNPNSRYHLSMKLDYPNQLDRKYAKKEGRTKPGGDIFIHGTKYSIGCLAMGDEAIQELYVLAARVGVKQIEVLIAPYDLRRHRPVKRHTDPDWVDALYADLQKRLAAFPREGAKPAENTDNAAKTTERHPADVLQPPGT